MLTLTQSKLASWKAEAIQVLVPERCKKIKFYGSFSKVPPAILVPNTKKQKALDSS